MEIHNRGSFGMKILEKSKAIQYSVEPIFEPKQPYQEDIHLKFCDLSRYVEVVPHSMSSNVLQARSAWVLENSSQEAKDTTGVSRDWEALLKLLGVLEWESMEPLVGNQEMVR